MGQESNVNSLENGTFCGDNFTEHVVSWNNTPGYKNTTTELRICPTLLYKVTNLSLILVKTYNTSRYENAILYEFTARAFLRIVYKAPIQTSVRFNVLATHQGDERWMVPQVNGD